VTKLWSRVWKKTRQLSAGLLLGYLSHQKHHFLNHLVACSVIASVVVLTKPFWASLEDPLAVYAHSVAASVEVRSQKTTAFRRLALVSIDDDRFQSPDHYAGSLPLDRCKLKIDIEQLLELGVPGLRMLAIDLDLSPIERSWPTRNPAYSRIDNTGRLEILDRAAVAQECQRRLNSLLMMPANASRLILMAPLATKDPTLAGEIKSWRLNMEKAGIRFGHVDLALTRGVTRVQQREDESLEKSGPTYYFGDLIHSRMRWDAKEPVVLDRYAARSSIPFQAIFSLYEDGTRLNLDHLCFLPRPQACEIDGVIFGASFGRDDDHLTPLGYLKGIEIHAANAVCLASANTYMVRSNLMHFAIELLVGALLFSPILYVFWNRYFLTRLGLRESCSERWFFLQVMAPTKPDAAYFWLVSMVVVIALVASFWIVVSAWFSADVCHTPVLAGAFLLGLLVEAAVFQGVHCGISAFTLHGLDSEKKKNGISGALYGGSNYILFSRICGAALVIFAIAFIMYDS
jgi:hypothetical protein